MRTMATFGARLEEIQYAAYIGITPPSFQRPEVPNLDPWARNYLAEQRRALTAAPPPPGPGGGGGAALAEAEEMGRELGAALSEAFAEELAAGMENVPQVFRDLAENAGNAIEAFSASFREQLIPVVVQVNDLARLGPDVPQSYRDAEAAIQEYRLGVWEAGVALVQARDEQRAAAWEVLQAENAYDFAAEAVGRYEDALANARDELRTWTNAQLEGTNAFNDAMFEIEQAIREKRLELLMAEMAGAAEEELGRIRAELDRLRQEAERLDLEHQINVAPALHDIEQLTRVSEEFSADEITGGIGDAQRAIDDIEPRLEDANELLDTQQTRLDDAGDAYDKTKKKVADAESVYETMVDVLGVLEKALRDETRSALDQFAWLEFGANAAKFTFRLFEDHVHQRLQPTLNSINTDNAQREINELTDAFWRLIAAQLEANNLGVATAGVQSFQGGGIVPGPQGAGRLVLAHGGEYIGPPGGRAGGGGSWRNYGTVVANFPNAHDAGAVTRELDRYFRGN
jgi:hypothetical protein